MTYAPSDIRPFAVAVITYRCRDIGYGVEEGSFEGYFVNYIDEWGKLSFTVVEGDTGHEALYLFADELVDVYYLDTSS